MTCSARGTHTSRIREDVDAKRAEHDVDRAEHRAERAEDDAAFATDYAIAAIEEAEYAVLDATLARQKADELSKQRPGARLRASRPNRLRRREVGRPVGPRLMNVKGSPEAQGAGWCAGNPVGWMCRGAIRTRRALGWMVNWRGGARVTASPSTPAATVPLASTLSDRALHARAARCGGPSGASITMIPSCPLSSAARAP
jgi:hypothetical protein